MVEVLSDLNNAYAFEALLANQIIIHFGCLYYFFSYHGKSEDAETILPKAEHSGQMSWSKEKKTRKPTNYQQAGRREGCYLQPQFEILNLGQEARIKWQFCRELHGEHT